MHPTYRTTFQHALLGWAGGVALLLSLLIDTQLVFFTSIMCAIACLWMAAQQTQRLTDALIAGGTLATVGGLPAAATFAARPWLYAQGPLPKELMSALLLKTITSIIFWTFLTFWGSIAMSIGLWKLKNSSPSSKETISPFVTSVGIILVILQIYPTTKTFAKLAESGARLSDNPFPLLSLQLFPGLTLLGLLITNLIWLFQAYKNRHQPSPPLLETIVTGGFLLVIQLNYIFALGLALAMLVVPAISPIVEGHPLEVQKLIWEYLKIHSEILTVLFITSPLLIAKPLLLKTLGQWLFRRLLHR